MWEAYDLKNEDFLWSCIPFMGGISRQQLAPCGAVSASAVVLGLRHRCSLEDREGSKKARTTIREHASEVVKGFKDTFGDITCRNLLGIDFSEPGGYQRFQESGIWKDKCNKYIEFIVEKLYELEDS